MFTAINLKKMFISILTVNLVGGISIAIAGTVMSRMFAEIMMPDLALPVIVIIIAWFVLFSLMGISLYFTQGSGASKENKVSARNRFWLQMIFLIVWQVLFFNARIYGFSAIWMLLTIVLIGICIKKFASIGKGASYLLIPYLLFCVYMLYLNYGIMMLNS